MVVVVVDMVVDRARVLWIHGVVKVHQLVVEVVFFFNGFFFSTRGGGGGGGGDLG